MASRVARLAGDNPDAPRYRRIDFIRDGLARNHGEIDALIRANLLDHGTRIKRSWYWSENQMQACKARLNVNPDSPDEQHDLLTAQQVLDAGVFASLEELAYAARWLGFPKAVAPRPRRWVRSAVHAWDEARRRTGSTSAPLSGQTEHDLRAAVEKLTATVADLSSRIDTLIASDKPAGAGTAA